MADPIYAYLAGPEVFFPDFDNLLAEKVAIAAQYGFIGIPSAENPGNMPPGPVTDAGIYQMNLELLQRSNLIIANIRAFRGAEPDSGTVFECAWGHTHGLPVFAYYDHANMPTAVDAMYPPVEWRSVEQEDGTFQDVPFDRDGNRIEDWGFMVNLMLTQSFPCIYGSFEDAVRMAAVRFGLLDDVPPMALPE